MMNIKNTIAFYHQAVAYSYKNGAHFYWYEEMGLKETSRIVFVLYPDNPYND